MILDNLFRVKGAAATFGSPSHEKPQSAAAVRELIVSSAPLSLRQLHIGSAGIRIGSACVAEEALKYALPGRGGGHGRKQSSTRMPFNLESKRHEQKSRGFAGL